MAAGYPTPAETTRAQRVYTFLTEWYNAALAGVAPATPDPFGIINPRDFPQELNGVEIVANNIGANFTYTGPGVGGPAIAISYAHRLVRAICILIDPRYFPLLKILTFTNQFTASHARRELIDYVIGRDLSPEATPWFEDFIVSVIQDPAIRRPVKQQFLHDIMRKIVVIDDANRLNYTLKQALITAGVGVPAIPPAIAAVAGAAAPDDGIGLDLIVNAVIPVGFRDTIALAAAANVQAAAVTAANAAAAAAAGGGGGGGAWFPADAVWVPAIDVVVTALKPAVYRAFFPYLYLFRKYNKLNPLQPFLTLTQEAVRVAAERCCGLTAMGTEHARIYSLLPDFITHFRNETALVGSILNGVAGVDRDRASHPLLYGMGPMAAPAVPAAPVFPAWGNPDLRAPVAAQMLLDAAVGRVFTKLTFPAHPPIPDATIPDLENALKICLSQDNFNYYYVQNQYLLTIPIIFAYAESIRAYITGITAASVSTDPAFAAFMTTVPAPAAYLNLINAPETLLNRLCALIPQDELVLFLDRLSAKNLDRYLPNTAGLTPMQSVLNTSPRKYKAARALWRFELSTGIEVRNPTAVPPAMVTMRHFYRAGYWFTPQYILSDELFYSEIDDQEFEYAYFAEADRVDPGTRSGRTTRSKITTRQRGYRGLPGRLFTKPVVAATPAQEPEIMRSAIDALNEIPDYTPKKDGATYDLLSIRDQLLRVNSAAVWDAAPIMPLIAKKGAVASKTITYDTKSLLQIGLVKGANPNLTDAMGNAAIHYITGFSVNNVLVGRITTPRPILLFQDLMDYYKQNTSTKPDFNLKDNVGNTPLHLILHQPLPSFEMLELIMQIPDIKYDEKNTAGDTALMMFFDPAFPALADGYDFERFKEVLKKSNIDVRNTAGRSLYEVAIRAASPRVPPGAAPRISDKQLASLIKLLVDEDDYPAAIALAGTTLPLTVAAIKSQNRNPVTLPSWLPAWVKEVLDSPEMSDKIVAEYEKYIAAVDTFIATAVPAPTANTFDSIKQFMAGDWMSWLRKTPLTRTWLGMVATSKEEPFPVQFDDDPATSISVQNPYDARYRAYTIYQPAGDPTHVPVAPPLTPAELDAAKRNNDVLRKFVGKEMITPTTQPFLRKVLESLYYATWNPSLGNDVMTALPDLLVKLESLYRFHQTHVQAKVNKSMKRKNIDIIGYLNMVISRRLPYNTTTPVVLAFPRIQFTGAIAAAAAAVAGGIIPVIPGLAAGRLLPPVVPGLAARRMVPLAPLAPIRGLPGRGAASAVINLFTGVPIATSMLTATYPTVITLDTSHIITYMPVAPVPLPPPPPVINYPLVPTTANGQEVRGNDPLYLFLQPLGLTAVFNKKFYILRPAEIFIVLFQLTPGAIDAALRDRRNPFVSLLRDYCVPAAIGYATAKLAGANVPALQRILTALQLI